MLKKFSLAGALIAVGATTMVPLAPAAAQYYDRDDRHGYYDRGHYDRYNGEYRRYDDRYDRRYYDRYYADRRVYRARNRCDGATGTILGAIAGGLIGNGIAGHGDRALGTVLGGGAGALAGRAIDKDNCRR